MTPEIKQRIQQIRQGKTPKGYKKTIVGIIPSDWSLKSINHWITLKERPIQLLDDEEYQLVTIRRGYGGVDSRGYFYGKDILVKTYFQIRENDFIISKRQIAHGACGVAKKYVDNAVVSNEYDVFIRNDCTDINMFNLMMQLPRFKRLFYLMSDGVHIEKLRFKTEDWIKQSLALPPLPEQTAIAEILSTQDRVIELKEQLLAEKKRQKKYLMQQLLTGKMRLKGFKGEWMECKLADFCTFIGGGTPSTNNDSFWKGDIPWISSSDLQNDNFDDIMITRFITEDAINNSATKLCPKGTILIVSRVGVGKIAIAPCQLCTSQDFTNLIQTDHCNKLLVYMLYFEIQKRISQVQGSAIKGLLTSEIKNISVCLPPLPEQTAIAEILSTADREIELIGQSIEAEKRKKKSLMQLLLTGIVRVP